MFKAFAGKGMSTEGSNVTGVPEKIGRYRVVRPLSKGGMALVYEARRESLAGVAPRVAIKVILPDFANSATFRELFINEARLGAAMQHQNLVQIQDFDAEDERFFLVMEYVEGLTLARMIGLAARHDLRIPLVVTCEIGRQACDGLHYAHQAVDTQGRPLGLVHRDVKPSNLIVNNQGGVKILDFGISKGTLRQERAGSVKGTWGYMAPEQANGERVGPNADIFALGIVLYEMAARRSMFKGREEDEIRRLLQDDHAARMASTLDAQYAPLVRVLIRALQRDPASRYAAGADLGRALSELLPDPITAREETVRFYKQIWELHEAEKGSGVAMPTIASRAAPSESAIPTARNAPVRWWASTPFIVGAAVVATASLLLLGYSVVRVSSPVGAPLAPSVASLAPGAPGAADPASPAPDAVAAIVPANHPNVAPTVIPGAVPGSVPGVAGPPDERPVPIEPDRSAPRVRGAETTEEPAAAVDRVIVQGVKKDATPSVDALLAQPPAAVGPARVPGPGAAPSVDTPAAANQGWLTLSCQQDAKIFVDGVQVSPGRKTGYSPGRHAVSFVTPDGRRIQKSIEVETGKERKLTWDFELFDFR